MSRCSAQPEQIWSAGYSKYYLLFVIVNVRLSATFAIDWCPAQVIPHHLPQISWGRLKLSLHPLIRGNKTNNHPHTHSAHTQSPRVMR